MNNYVNITMKKINDLTDEIYEGLMDQEYDDVKKAIAELNTVLKDIQQNIKDEIH